MSRRRHPSEIYESILVLSKEAAVRSEVENLRKEALVSLPLLYDPYLKPVIKRTIRDFARNPWSYARPKSANSVSAEPWKDVRALPRPQARSSARKAAPPSPPSPPPAVEPAQTVPAADPRMPLKPVPKPSSTPRGTPGVSATPRPASAQPPKAGPRLTDPPVASSAAPRQAAPTPLVMRDSRPPSLAVRSRLDRRELGSSTIRQLRVFYDLNAPDLLSIEPLITWSREKSLGQVTWGQPGEYADDKRVVASVVAEEEGRRWVELRVAEAMGFHCHIIAGAERDGARWLWVEVTHAKLEVELPTFLRELISDSQLLDVDLSVSEQPLLCAGPKQVAEITEHIMSPRRRLPVTVVMLGQGDPEDPFQEIDENREWRRLFPVGFLVIVRHGGSAAFAETMGAGFEVMEGRARTFLPGVDPGSRMDAIRHKYLPPSISDPQGPQQILRAAAQLSRRAWSETPDVPAVREASTVLRRQEDLERRARFVRERERIQSANEQRLQERRAVQQAEPTQRPEEAQLNTLLDLVGAEELDDDLILRLASGVQEGQALQRENDELREAIAEQQTELAETEEERVFYEEFSQDRAAEVERLSHLLEEVQARSNYLMSELRQQDPEAANSAFAISAETVESYEELREVLGREEVLPHVIFVGDLETLDEMDEADTQNRGPQKVWRILSTLSSYCAYQREIESCSMLKYLTNDSLDFPVLVSAAQFAAKESETTMNAYGEHRRFPVPAEVDPSGSVVMESHFKLPIKQMGRKEPRIHFHVAPGAEATAYVGYVGVHLPTGEK